MYRPANLWTPECGSSNFGMRDTEMACIAKHSKQNDKMTDIPDFRTFFHYQNEGLSLKMRDIWQVCYVYYKLKMIHSIWVQSQVLPLFYWFLTCSVSHFSCNSLATYRSFCEKLRSGLILINLKWYLILSKNQCPCMRWILYKTRLSVKARGSSHFGLRKRPQNWSTPSQYLWYQFNVSPLDTRLLY